MALITSVLTGGVNNHETTSEEVNAVITDFASEGIVGAVSNTSGVAPATGGFAVNAQGTPDMTVAVSAGVAYVTGTPSSQNSQTFRVKNTASQNVTISANSSGSTKYDWVYIKLDATKLNAPNTAGDDVATLVTSRSSSATSDDGTPPTYGYPIAVVTVANGASSITNGNIADSRTQTGMTPIATAVSTASWASLGATPASVVNNGNRSYTLTFNSTDLTDDLSVGMRLKLTRTVTAPTQCTDLEASSSQYFNDTTVSGMTFTDDFVAGAWIKVESYAAMTIISRYNGTSGWSLELLSDGRVILNGRNGSASNESYVLTYQSVPLNKWVHVAAQLDMSAFTASTTTSYVMIDGVDVPATVARGGTNPTALVQAGDLQVGAGNTTRYFDGKIAQVFVTSAKVTQANVRTIMSQGITASDVSTHSMVSAYSMSNSLTDLNTTNANNLTAQGSAVATSTDSPFAGGNVQEYTDGTTEMGILTSVSFSTNTTAVVQVPEGYAIPTSGGVSAVSYSTQKIPYGFPADRGKWRVESLVRVSLSGGTTALTYARFTNWEIAVPAGTWMFGMNACLALAKSAASQADITATLSTSTSAATDARFTLQQGVQDVFRYAGQFVVEDSLSLSSQTTYYILAYGGLATINSLSARGDTGKCLLYAECAYV